MWCSRILVSEEKGLGKMNPLVVEGVAVAKHAILRFISVLCVALVIGGLGWAVYVAFVRPTTKPNPTTTQKADTMYNPTYNIKIGLGGCARLPVVREK